MLSLPASIAAGTGLGLGPGGFSRSVLSHRTNKKHIESMLGFLVQFKGISWEIGSYRPWNKKIGLQTQKTTTVPLDMWNFWRKSKVFICFRILKSLPEQKTQGLERFGCCTWFRITFHNSHDYVPCIYIYIYLNRPPCCANKLSTQNPLRQVCWWLGFFGSGIFGMGDVPAWRITGLVSGNRISPIYRL